MTERDPNHHPQPGDPGDLEIADVDDIDDGEQVAEEQGPDAHGKRVLPSGPRPREHRPSRRTLNREDRRQRSARRRARKRLAIGLIGSTIALVLITGLALPSFGHLIAPPSNVDSGVGTQVAIQDARTLEPGEEFTDYNSVPPTSGPSYPEGVPWGVYQEQQQDERVVRNLREGGVIISYNLLDATVIEDLQSAVEDLPGYPGCYVLQPYESLPVGSITLTSWGWMQTFLSVDRTRIRAFADDHRNRGPIFAAADCGFVPESAG